MLAKMSNRLLNMSNTFSMANQYLNINLYRAISLSISDADKKVTKTAKKELFIYLILNILYT